MNNKIRRQLARRKRRIEQRLDKTRFGGDCPMIAATNMHYELADRTQAISAGGIGLIHQLVKRLELDQAINPPCAQHSPSAISPARTSQTLERAALEESVTDSFAENDIQPPDHRFAGVIATTGKSVKRQCLLASPPKLTRDE